MYVFYLASWSVNKTTREAVSLSFPPLCSLLNVGGVKLYCIVLHLMNVCKITMEEEETTNNAVQYNVTPPTLRSGQKRNE